MEQLLKCHQGSRNLKKMDKVRDCFSRRTSTGQVGARVDYAAEEASCHGFYHEKNSHEKFQICCLGSCESD